MTKNTLGKLPGDAFGMLELPAIAERRTRGLSRSAGSHRHCLGCDGRTRHCRRGAGGAALPRDPSARLVGRALTVRNVAAAAPVPDKVKAGISGLGEIEAHNLAEPGDVIVLQGVDLCSNLGGIPRRSDIGQGELGAIVDGGVRDVDHSRGIGYPIWSKSVSPITGKWRVETVAINKPVDDLRHYGRARRPRARRRDRRLLHSARRRATDVLARAQRNAAAEKLREEKIASGAPVSELFSKAR